ncbi:MAG: Sir2 family NAD+-dependent deacetylase [Pseudomonadota bacterium]
MAAYRNIVILTGAGISAESGLGTFRGPGGLWEGQRVEDVATPQAFARDPDLVQDFYNMRRRALAHVAPNPAHRALARLEAEYPGAVLIITQNVDDLHERAGSRNLIHMHGELNKARCCHCGTVHDWRADLLQTTPCPACQRAPSLRPHIVWFGEMPFAMEAIDRALARCDLFLSIGTSGHVYPAAGFVETVRYYRRAHTVELNLEPSLGSASFAEAHHGPAGKIVPDFVAGLLAETARSMETPA